MKEKKVFIVSAMICIAFSISVTGQAYQSGWTFVLDNEPAVCLGENVSGTMTYHAVVKFDREGYLKSVKWNCVDGFFIGSESGNRYKLIDGGKDDLGWFWSYFVTDIPLVDAEKLPPVFPEDGILLNRSLMWVAQGQGPVVHGFMKAMIRLNAHGDLTAEIMDLSFCD